MPESKARSNCNSVIRLLSDCCAVRVERLKQLRWKLGAFEFQQ
jgi:hypothetical protein